MSKDAGRAFSQLGSSLINISDKLNKLEERRSDRERREQEKLERREFQQENRRLQFFTKLPTLRKSFKDSDVESIANTFGFSLSDLSLKEAETEEDKDDKRRQRKLKDFPLKTIPVQVGEKTFHVTPSEAAQAEREATREFEPTKKKKAALEQNISQIQHALPRAEGQETPFGQLRSLGGETLISGQQQKVQTLPTKDPLRAKNLEEIIRARQPGLPGAGATPAPRKLTPAQRKARIKEKFIKGEFKPEELKELERIGILKGGQLTF